MNSKYQGKRFDIGLYDSMCPTRGATSQDCNAHVEEINKAVMNEQELALVQSVVQPIQFHSMPVKTITTPGSTLRKLSVDSCTHTPARVHANTRFQTHITGCGFLNIFRTTLPLISRSFSFCNCVPEMTVTVITLLLGKELMDIIALTKQKITLKDTSKCHGSNKIFFGQYFGFFFK